MLIQYAFNFTLVYSKIAHIDAYPIDPTERDNLGAIIVYDDADEVDSSSRIEQYYFDLRDKKVDSTNVTIARNLTFKALYAERLEQNTFKVTAIKLIRENGLLVIALRDVGIMLYDFDQHKTIKIVTIKSRLQLDTLMITAIDPSTEYYFRLLTRDSGVITIGYTNMDSSGNGPYQGEPYLYES